MITWRHSTDITHRQLIFIYIDILLNIVINICYSLLHILKYIIKYQNRDNTRLKRSVFLMKCWIKIHVYWTVSAGWGSGWLQPNRKSKWRRFVIYHMDRNSFSVQLKFCNKAYCIFLLLNIFVIAFFRKFWVNIRVLFKIEIRMQNWNF